MGYCTLYGDAVGALGVIADLTKSQVYAVARWYNAHRGAGESSRGTSLTAPSAELRPGQKDADSIPCLQSWTPCWRNCWSLPPRGGTSP